MLEVELFPWQKWFLIHALELLADGTYRFRIVLLLVARQNGKSLLLQILSLFRMYVDDVPLVLGTAQSLDVAEEIWQGAVDIVNGIPDLASEVEHVDMTNGKKALKLISGSRYKVQAATRRAGRSLTADLVLLDELREQQNFNAWGAVTKTTRTRAHAQILAASNAGDETSKPLAHLRTLAHLALGDPDGLFDEQEAVLEFDQEDDTLFIAEWSAEPDCDIWDRQGWAQANPSMGHIPSMERSIASDARSDPEAVFRTEVLCQWVDTMSEGAFPPGVWESTRVSETVQITGTPVIALDVRTGVRQSFALTAVGAGKKADVLELVHYESGVDQRWARDHIVDTTVEILKARGIYELVMDKYGENGHLAQRFEDNDISIVWLDTLDMRSGTAAITDGLVNRTLVHHGDEPLSVAVLGAGKRKSVEGFLWSQSMSTTDITALRSATAAYWAHVGEPGEYDLMDSFG